MTKNTLLLLSATLLATTGCRTTDDKPTPVAVTPASSKAVTTLEAPRQGGGFASAAPQLHSPSTPAAVRSIPGPEAEPPETKAKAPIDPEHTEPITLTPSSTEDEPEAPEITVVEEPTEFETGKLGWREDLSKSVSPVAGPAVAIVNGYLIPWATYDAEIQKITSRSATIPEERMKRIRENILKRLIETELIRQATAHIRVPKSELEAEFAEYKLRFRNDEQFQNYLTHGKVTVESIRRRIEEKLRLEMLLDERGALTVTDAQIEEFYTKNERFYVEREGVKVRHILVKVAENAPAAEVAAARAKIDAALSEVREGAPFDEVAKRVSEGPSAPKGGDLGFFGRGQMVEPFEKAAFAMNSGTISDEPVRTRFGWHLIEVLERRETRKKPLEEVHDTIAESLRNKYFFQQRRALLNELKSKATIRRLDGGAEPGAPGAAESMP